MQKSIRAILCQMHNPVYFRLVLNHLREIHRFYPLDKIFPVPASRTEAGEASAYSEIFQKLDPKLRHSTGLRDDVRTPANVPPLPASIPGAQFLQSASYRIR